VRKGNTNQKNQASL